MSIFDESALAILREGVDTVMEERNRLAERIGEAAVGRLVQLFEERSDKQRQWYSTFEDWLYSCFYYDIFVAENIFQSDGILAELRSLYGGLGFRDEYVLSEIVNAGLRERGYNCALNRTLNSTRSV